MIMRILHDIVMFGANKGIYISTFSQKSREKLDTCHIDLQEVCELVIPNYDFSVLEGFRPHARQEELFRQGKSKLRAGFTLPATP